ncbi:hypothetical protein DSM106972_060640 [Dulcicalothrix desertica PCC 7102]|uniref:Uncharacterized protein n=1 Tax=Dulcicalothrix desertica PCC 7102 TaxID=232991 RepID=A0A3S1AJX1_9CYAN|nr:hypothetical protein [Dulcicalothrix desertica]RUT02586.1 hypothetical protein DSM106972_060640 [Dulcicalothrix desertica PCC 7102]TWH55202.1 hypothetical protein CAL7102_03319 [Dulcicalothrix desertica PCC 7102]
MKNSIHKSLSINTLQVENILKLFNLYDPRLEAKIRIVKAILMLGIAVPVWVATEGIAPQLVRAYTATGDIVIDRLFEETYQNMLTRAEAAARAAAQRTFDQDILITEVSVIVSGQNYGAIAPILELRVSRQQWRNRPDPKVWAKYFKTARSLLQFDSSLTQQPVPQPEPAPAPASPRNPNQ